MDSKDSYRNDVSLRWQIENSCMKLVVFMAVNLHIVEFKIALSPTLFIPRKDTRWTLYRRQGAPQNPSELMRKMPPLPEFDPRPSSPQPVDTSLGPCHESVNTLSVCQRRLHYVTTVAKTLKGTVDHRLSLHTAKCAACSTRFRQHMYTGCSVFIGTPTVIHYWWRRRRYHFYNKTN